MTTSRNSQVQTERKTYPIHTIGRGVERVAAKERPDQKDDKEWHALAKHEQHQKIDEIRQKNIDKRINRKLRAGIARSVFCYLSCYSLFSASMVVLNGLNLLLIPEAALAAIVGGTAIAAIGLVGFVVNGLFKGINS